MTSTSPFTPEDLPVAYRDAVAIALAGVRHDGAGIAALWNGSPSQPALVYALARLPGLLLRAGGATAAAAVDPEATLHQLVREMPTALDQLDHPEE